MRLLKNFSKEEQHQGNFGATLILIMVCFALWGFTNDITGVMVSAFSRIFVLDMTQGSMVNVASFMGYLVLAIPAAIFTQRYTYKKGVILSLLVYATGILLLLPAKGLGVFHGFLLSYFIMTCGSAALETCCHPLVYRMGDERKGIFRLNLAQAFNALGACIGMLVAITAITKKLSKTPAEVRAEMPKGQFEILKQSDLNTIIQPYLYVAAVIFILIVIIWGTRFYVQQKESHKGMPAQAFGRLMHIRNYWEGLIAQFFYIGAQICIFTYILVYGKHLFMSEGMLEVDAEMLVSHYSMVAVIIYAVMRFLCTWLLAFIAPGRLLSVMAIAGTATVAGSMIFTDRNGLYCLLVACGTLSMMFPTIYGMALRGVGDDIKYASAGLTMTVFAGAVFPPLQAAIIEWGKDIMGIPAVNISFIVPLVCLAVVIYYGHSGYVRHHITHDYQS